LKLRYLFIALVSSNAFSQAFVEKEEGAAIGNGGIPWELFVDRGKLLGCIYDSRFYSLGSILVLESLPRKCELASDRTGMWAQLSEAEMLLFKENIETQQKHERESTYIGKDPINEEEARVIKYLRRAKAFADKQQN
jgi:hypothetical protein